MPARTINDVSGRHSRKRDREPKSDGESDGQDISDTHQASSTFRKKIKKRARVSRDRPSNGARSKKHDLSGESSAEDEEKPDVEDEDRLLNSPPKTQYEQKRDGDFSYLQNEAADDQRATQRFHRPKLLGNNHAAENGILEMIECYNFMCHEHLKVVFGPLLNFVVGENGSGKSAILTGVTLCLGGKASSTNRGGSLKSFVKEGTERSMLSVTLKNQGESAYKREVYGDSIVVERHFSKTGSSSGFKVKSVAGNIISTKRQEVDEIVEYYALQVDNPLTILSQDNARQFLNASSKAQKYKYFIEGVQLQQLDTDYSLLQESIERIESKLPDLEEDARIARAKYKESARMFELFKGNRELRIQSRELAAKIVWAQVRDHKMELARRVEAVLKEEGKIADAQRDVEEKTQHLQIYDDRISERKATLEATKEAGNENREQAEEASIKWDEQYKEVQCLYNEEREAREELKQADNGVKALAQKIDEEKRRLEEATGDAPTRKHDELKAAQAELVAFQQQLEECKVFRPALTTKMADAEKAISEARDLVQAKKSEIQALATKVRSLEQGNSNKYAGFDPGIPALLRAIDNDDRFEQKPVGPIGAHVQLLKPRWSNILEKQLGDSLNAFVVVSKQDERLLREWMKHFKIKKDSVMVARNKRALNIEGRQPDPNYETILRALKIDNDLIRDQLIINNSIEQIILEPERTHAEHIMFDGTSAPKNVKACLTFNEGKRGHGLRLTNNYNSIQTTPVIPWNQTARMSTNSSSQLAEEKDAMVHLQEELRQAANREKQAQQQIQLSQLELDKLKKAEADLKTKIRKNQALQQNIEFSLDDFEGADGRLRGLEEQMTEIRQRKEHFGNLYGELKATKLEKNKVAEAAKKELDAKRAKVELDLKEVEKMEGKVKDLERKRDAVAQEKNKAVYTLEQCEEERNQAVGRRDRQQARIPEWIAQAEKISKDPPVITDADVAENLNKQYNRVRQQLAQFDLKHGATYGKVKAEKAMRQKEYQRSSNVLESNQALLTRMCRTLDLRIERWRLFQRLISARARTNFQYLLTARGFRGKLLIDHKNRALDLTVEPDPKGERQARGRTTKTLSGGEKSFSSICLLLAIWEAMGSPLRCLDEFDVFMDNVNRAISTNMLIEAARASVNRQYIFITPNPINNIAKDVKIHRMTDPRQRTLPM